MAEGEGDRSESSLAVVKREKRPSGVSQPLLGAVYSRPKSEYISPTGVSTLDIRTRLRITEAELAIVQREYSDVLAEKNVLETSLRQYEESWKFAVQELGRVVEQRDDALKRVELCEKVEKVGSQQDQTAKKKLMSSKVPRSELEQCQLSLETQTRVCKTLEAERERAFDNCQEMQAQLRTLMQQYHELAAACAEVAREKEKATAEANLLRAELHRGSRKDDSSRSLNGSVEDSISELPASEHPLYKQLKELNEEKDTLQMMYEQAIKGAEQYQKQLHRADEERRHALATSEALAALWQKKFENAQNENRALQNENMEIRQDLRSYDNRVSHLQELLAQFRLQSRGLPGMNGDGVNNERLSPLQGSQHDTYDILSPEEGDEASWI
ncbi:hypothetical protein EMCRGX_G006498 [Ephydatia muelleri]